MPASVFAIVGELGAIAGLHLNAPKNSIFPWLPKLVGPDTWKRVLVIIGQKILGLFDS